MGHERSNIMEARKRKRQRRTVRGVFVSKAEISKRRSVSEALKDTIEVTGVAEIP